MLVERGVIRLGLEVEVPSWKGRTFASVCSDLVDAEYMIGPASQWETHHKYHCNCSAGGCKQVRSGDLIVPPLVSMTYDASLPQSGAEFIISPILLEQQALRERLEEPYSIIVHNAEWSNNLPNWHGNGTASPSIHMHVSVSREDGYDLAKKKLSSSPGHPDLLDFKKDIFHAISLFAPELFALADTASVRRGVQYRLPSRLTVAADKSQGNQNGHHGFVQVKWAIPDKFVYIEWRLFEAAYDDWKYVESAAYFAAAMTRSWLSAEILSIFMSEGYRNSYDDRRMVKAVREDDVMQVLKLVNIERFNTLRNVALAQLDDDPYGLRLVEELFMAAERKMFK